jgi:hypothetical protein
MSASTLHATGSQAHPKGAEAGRMFRVGTDSFDCAAAARSHIEDVWLPYDVLLFIYADRYTLGGVYLARYEDSPAGTFDEVGTGDKLVSSSHVLSTRNNDKSLSIACTAAAILQHHQAQHCASCQIVAMLRQVPGAAHL